MTDSTLDGYSVKFTLSSHRFYKKKFAKDSEGKSFVIKIIDYAKISESEVDKVKEYFARQTQVFKKLRRCSGIENLISFK